MRRFFQQRKSKQAKLLGIGKKLLWNPKTSFLLSPPVQQGHHPASVMIWWDILYHVVTEINFCEAEVKTNLKMYCSMLGVVLSHTMILPFLKTYNWCFQQDSTCHTVKQMQSWLSEHIPDFITSSELPATSPELNPLDYQLWQRFEEVV